MSNWEPTVYEFARVAHGKQLDDSGKNYFQSHVLQTVALVKQLTTDEDIISAAYMHDLIEDTDVTFEEIQRRFGLRTADLVHEVTHEGEKDNYGRYFPRLHTKEGIMLKLCDRASNVSRMDSWSKDRQEHYLRKTKFWKDGSDL